MRTTFLAAATVAVLSGSTMTTLSPEAKTAAPAARSPAQQRSSTAGQPLGYSVLPDASGWADD
jgi:hypothetical protein